MKYRLLFIMLLLSGLVLNAQKIKVVDNSSLQPVEHVVITGTISRASVITDTKGEAEISVFDRNEEVVIKKAGYHLLMILLPAPGATERTVFLTEKTYSLDEVVISANKFEEKKADVPQQIQVISAKSIQFASQPNTAELLQNSGNVTVQKSQGGGGSPIIRGFEANKVLLVIDGVRMNNAIYRGGHLQNVLTIDNSILDRAEIVFGPGSVIYGSDALGGVMHFFTRQPRLSTDEKPYIAVNLMSRYSTAFDEKTGHFNVNIGYNKLAFLTAFTFSDFGDLRQGNIRSPFAPAFGRRDFYVAPYNGMDSAFVNNKYNVQVGSGYKQYDFMQKVLYKQGEAVSHIFNFQYSTSSDIPRYDRLVQTRSNGQPRFADWHYGPQDRLFLSYTLDINSKRDIYDRARFIVAYQDIQESRHDRNYRSVTLNNRKENVGICSFNLDLQKQHRRKELRYGVEFTQNNVTSTAFAENIETGARSPLDTRYASGGSSMKSSAIYFTENIEFGPKLIFTNGLRFNYVTLDAKFSDKTFFPFPFDEVNQKNAALNGSLGLIYKPAEAWRLSAVASTGFRAPNVDDLSKVFESVPGNIILPNPGLGPEKTYNAELSVSRTFDSKIRAELTGWYTRYVDALTVKPSTFNGSDSIVYNGELSRVTTMVNAQNAYLYGISANLNAEVTNVFSILSSINYTFGRIKTDSTDYPLDHVPPVFGQTSFNLVVKKFRSEFFVRYSGWKRLKDYNQVGEDNLSQATPAGMPGWYTLNLRTAYQVSRFFHVQAALENILDQNYRVFASGISAPGRNLILTLRARF